MKDTAPSCEQQKLFERLHEQLGRKGTPDPPELDNPEIKRGYLAWRERHRLKKVAETRAYLSSLNP